MSRDDEFETTVLSTDYSDYHDTVVDQADAFDPAVLQGEAERLSGKPQRPTWVHAGAQPKAQSQPQANVSPSATVAPASVGSSPARAEAGPANVSANPVAAGSFVSPAQMNNAEAAYQPVTPNQSVAPGLVEVKSEKTSPALIVAIAVLGAVGVIAIAIVAFMLLGPQSDSGKAAESASVSVSVPAVSSGSSSGASTESEAMPAGDPEPEKSAEASGGRDAGSPAIVNDGDGRAISEAEFYRALSEYYDLAGRYDSNVRSAASDFNNTYQKEERSEREANAKSASSLKSKIEASWGDLESLEPPMMSKNTQAYRDICELYECLWHRIDVVDRAWKIDLQYDDPRDHQSDIIAPLSAQQVNGTDRYFARFSELYPQVSLVRP